jgi:hypothetical protein
LPPLGALYDVKLYLLAFLQAAESARLDRREVDENVLTALTADETIALGIVKPLYCSCFHGVTLDSLFVGCALCQWQNFFRQVTLLSRELLKNCKDQTQQDCTSGIPEIAKVFRWLGRKPLYY